MTRKRLNYVSLTGGLLDSVTARQTSANSNVFFHVVDDEAWPFSLGQRHVDPWVAWLDLEDRQGWAAMLFSIG